MTGEEFQDMLNIISRICVKIFGLKQKWIIEKLAW